MKGKRCDRDLSIDCKDALDLNQKSSLSAPIEGNICCFIDCERYRELLLKVTCFVKRFVQNLKARVGCGGCLEEDLTVTELNEAKLDWGKYEKFHC